MKFSGRNVLITGASRGIGADMARILASFGLKVWINYRSDSAKAQKLSDEINALGQKSAIVQFDATNESDFKDAINLINDSDGEFSYLVNNAGITKDKLSIMMKLEDFDEVIKANLNSCFIGSREALKIMSKKRFGSIVNISSIVGEKGNAGQVNYSASKGGIIALTKSFALESAARGIRFNAITPGFIQTEMTDVLSDEVKNKYIDAIPLKRLGTAQEIAYSTAFLLSDYSSYITGEILRVNGGLYT